MLLIGEYAASRDRESASAELVALVPMRRLGAGSTSTPARKDAGGLSPLSLAALLAPDLACFSFWFEPALQDCAEAEDDYGFRDIETMIAFRMAAFSLTISVRLRARWRWESSALCCRGRVMRWRLFISTTPGAAPIT